MVPINRCRRAFSLIEVLVVLALILAIVGILMPVLQWTVGQGRSVDCADNLRQIDLAALQYSQENRSFLPLAKTLAGAGSFDLENLPVGMSAPESLRLSFSDLVFPYLISDVTYKWDGRRVENSHYEDQKIFQCAAATRYTGNTVGNGKINSYNGQILDYGMNNYGRPNGDRATYAPSLAYGVNGDQWPHPRLASVANTSAVYIIDAEYDSSPEDIGGVSRGKQEWPLRYSMEKDTRIRHMGGYNCVTLDGSVVWRSAEEYAWEYFTIRRRY